MDKSEATRQLRALNARFIHNFVTNDVPSHDAITHADFTYVSSEGVRRGRNEYLRRWATGFDPDVIIYWDYRDEHIGVFGNIGLVWSVNKHVIVEAGKEVIGMTGYTDTYLLEDGAWKCIQAQLVPMAPDNYPSDATIVRRYIRGVKYESIESLNLVP
ncbi:nuclear transport factor 2 family protein [Aestuariivirga sp. YIM B02566]|uniref:Nuclear transport factor 2 family protein n=1 Tax=Taklimakanibacter albus TaxID=2800327 RepID=A0ACC5R455_9HYPH|nr:nuclear transport factor 2 family protein [Aestuariivirga sp. YIM B02566]MBK1867388.1 nuclear transport factor 2 family protein [Aestuariivirga sp. YIM B02566]